MEPQFEVSALESLLRKIVAYYGANSVNLVIISQPCFLVTRAYVLVSQGRGRRLSLTRKAFQILDCRGHVCFSFLKLGKLKFYLPTNWIALRKWIEGIKFDSTAFHNYKNSRKSMYRNIHWINWSIMRANNENILNDRRIQRKGE